MGELTRRAAEMRTAQDGTNGELRRLQARQEALQREMRGASRERVSEFIGLIRRKDVPRIPVYAHLVRPGDRIQFRAPVTLGIQKIGAGWEVQPRIHDGNAEILQDGLFVFPNGTAARCFEVRHAPAAGRHPINEAPHALAMSHIVEGGDFPFEPDKTFGTDEGLAILGAAMLRYEIA